jgi:hypothetical protein
MENDTIDRDWSTIFKDINMHEVPFEYVESISITFKDSKKPWIIQITNETDWVNIRESLHELSTNYSITGVDFNVNLLKIKQYISNLTSSLLTSIKL